MFQPLTVSNLNYNNKSYLAILFSENYFLSSMFMNSSSKFIKEYIVK